MDVALQTPGFQRFSAPARAILGKTGLLQAMGLEGLEAGLPEAHSHADWRGVHPAQGEETARVALFLGCTAELADAATVSAVIGLLNRLGVSVHVPAEQGCCGALALHSGDGEEAARLQNQNMAAFAQYDALVTVASGCGAMLSEYADAPDFGKKVKDISRFLAEHRWPEAVKLAPLQAKAMIHAPCSLKNVLRSDRYAPELLKRIPGLQVETLPKLTGCCGAAGSYMLEYPQTAEALRDEILEKFVAAAPDYVLTSNVGCAMHLRAGLKARNLGKTQVLHPANLLYRQLEA
jgi:glycolate oxidase iron-sulfur subunit